MNDYEQSANGDSVTSNGVLCVSSCLLAAFEKADKAFKDGKITAAEKMAANMVAIVNDYQVKGDV